MEYWEVEERLTCEIEARCSVGTLEAHSLLSKWSSHERKRICCLLSPRLPTVLLLSIRFWSSGRDFACITRSYRYTILCNIKGQSKFSCIHYPSTFFHLLS